MYVCMYIHESSGKKTGNPSQLGVFDLFSGKPPNSHTFGGEQLLRSNSRPKPSFGHPPCARTHSAHTKVQLYRFARRAVLVHTTATSSLMCHVITWSGDVSHRSGKDMRKKDEEWPRTGTFCAAWGRIFVMQWPIFTGHFEALRLLQNWVSSDAMCATLSSVGHFGDHLVPTHPPASHRGQPGAAWS